MTTNAFRFRVEMSDRVLPSTNIFAGGTFPAAVICPVKNLPNSLAVSITARYPAILA